MNAILFREFPILLFGVTFLWLLYISFFKDMEKWGPSLGVPTKGPDHAPADSARRWPTHARIEQELDRLEAENSSLPDRVIVDGVAVDVKEFSRTMLTEVRKQKVAALQKSRSDLIVRMSITIPVLAASLFVILATRYTPQDKHWGYATVGTILGYWLKGK